MPLLFCDLDHVQKGEAGKDGWRLQHSPERGREEEESAGERETDAGCHQTRSSLRQPDRTTRPQAFARATFP